jgi:transglutaminase-like putative cysteine protease
MTLSISAKIAYEFPAPSDFLLQMEAAVIPEQVLSGVSFHCTPTEHFARVPAQDMIGERIWLRHQGEFVAEYSATAAIERILAPIEQMRSVPTHLLPGETVQYLMDSRYCPADRFQSFVATEFGKLSGGTQVLAMRDWISRHFTYVSGSSNSNTNALDSFVERRGVCRDYAHMLITFARAAAIPARFASIYAPDVDPQDFHAVAELFLADSDADEDDGGAWHMVDATGMAQPCDIAKIGIGRDAADVSFLTSYGTAIFHDKQITVTRQEPPSRAGAERKTDVG